VNENTSLYCGWCEATKECVMGDAAGPFFGRCEKWSIVGNDESMKHCEGVLNTAQKVGIGVGVSIGGILLIAIAVWGYRRCHRKRKDHVDSELVPSGFSS
jgi:hypothetical protein